MSVLQTMIVIIPKVKLHRNEHWKRALHIEIELLSEATVGASYIRQCLQMTQTLFTLELHYEHCSETLRQYLKRMRAIQMPLLGDFVVHLQRGLQFVHSHDIVHQDISSNSIFISEKYGQPILKLGNFKNATMVFTPSKQSPLNEDASYVTFQSDLFSLGLVLYEMITERITPTVGTGLYSEAFPMPSTCPELLQNVIALLVPLVKIASIEKLGQLPFFYHRYCGLAYMPAKQLQTLSLDLASAALTDEEAHRTNEAILKYRRSLDIFEAITQTQDGEWLGLNDIISSLDKRLRGLF